MRKVIIDETPVNPKYYERMSELLDALIVMRKEQAGNYEKYLAEIVALAKQVVNPSTKIYPAAINTGPKQALFDNLDKNEVLAIAIDAEDPRGQKGQLAREQDQGKGSPQCDPGAFG